MRNKYAVTGIQLRAAWERGETWRKAEQDAGYAERDAARAGEIADAQRYREWNDIYGYMRKAYRETMAALGLPTEEDEDAG